MGTVGTGGAKPEPASLVTVVRCCTGTDSVPETSAWISSSIVAISRWLLRHFS